MILLLWKVTDTKLNYEENLHSEPKAPTPTTQLAAKNWILYFSNTLIGLLFHAPPTVEKHLLIGKKHHISLHRTVLWQLESYNGSIIMCHLFAQT